MPKKKQNKPLAFPKELNVTVPLDVYHDIITQTVEQLRNDLDYVCPECGPRPTVVQMVDLVSSLEWAAKKLKPFAKVAQDIHREYHRQG